MRMRYGAALTALVLAVAMPVAAQETAPDTARLTLEAAVERGVELSEEVRSTRAQRQIAEGQVVEARAGALPDRKSVV